MKKKEEQEFVVSDRRRFGSEGDFRTDIAKREDDAPMPAPVEKIDETGSSARLIENTRAENPKAEHPKAEHPKAEKAKAEKPEAEKPEAAAISAIGDTAASPEAATDPDGNEIQEPPSEGEQLEQYYAYKASGKKLDELFQSKLGAQGAYPEMTFEKVVESLYMSALIQMGAIRQDGETQAQIDIIDARQTIDSITLIHDKTVGNLSDRERSLMQNVLFELRMAWIELTNAIAARAANPPSGVIAPPGVMPGPK